jgi:hypothetical protein
LGCDLDHRGDERSGDAVTGDVGDEKAEAVLIEGEDVIVVLTDGTCRLPDASHLDAAQLRYRLGQEVLLKSGGRETAPAPVDGRR